MQKTLTLLVFITIFCTTAYSQTPRQVIVEHFTNTLCGICASKNPAFYSTLDMYPDVLHISYHPSAPYAHCIFSKENKPENDARTNYYGIYGGTPRAVIQGTVIPAQSPTILSSDITPQLNRLSPFDLRIKMTRQDQDSVDVRLVILTTDTHSYHSLHLFAAVTEDTIFYHSANGETIHYNVFHKQLFAGNGLIFTPSIVHGDSVVLTSGFRMSGIDSIWDRQRVNLIAFIQDTTSKLIVQSAKQTKTDTLSSVQTGINSGPAYTDPGFYPNPAHDHVFFSTDEPKIVSVISVTGSVIKEQTDVTHTFPISDIANGYYYIRITGKGNSTAIRPLVIIN